MKNFLKPAFATGLLLAAATPMLATPASAQVNGMATSSPEAAIVRAAARIAAYQQIDQTYAAQMQQARTVQQEMATLQGSLDTNSDGQLTEQEVQANPGVVQQIRQKEAQLQQIGQPIVLAQYYVLEQLVNDYNNAQQQVLAAKNINVLLTPDAVQYAPDNFNVTSDIVAALDQRLPTVSATPPAGFRPRRETVALHQTVQQVLSAAAQQAAARAAPQQQPAAQQPSGR